MTGERWQPPTKKSWLVEGCKNTLQDLLATVLALWGRHDFALGLVLKRAGGLLGKPAKGSQCQSSSVQWSMCHYLRHSLSCQIMSCTTCVTSHSLNSFVIWSPASSLLKLYIKALAEWGDIVMKPADNMGHCCVVVHWYISEASRKLNKENYTAVQHDCINDIACTSHNLHIRQLITCNDVEYLMPANADLGWFYLLLKILNNDPWSIIRSRHTR